MRGESRHSTVEYLVFGLALALMMVLGYQGLKRGLPALLASWSGAPGPRGHYRDLDAGTSVPAAAPAPAAVGFVAAVKAIPGGEGKKRVVSVPSPARR